MNLIMTTISRNLWIQLIKMLDQVTIATDRWLHG
jgi:hypothetical protein